jgi:6-phosphogluconolactonase (cycloisomerase 2 family)
LAGCGADGSTAVYAVSENGDDSGLYSFENRKGKTKAASGLKPAGADPCFIMDMNGEYIFTADYSGGSISIFPVKEGALGELCEQLVFEGSGPVEGRQESSHIHQIRQVPATGNIGGDWLVASDLGADVIRLIFVSRIDSQMHGQSIMPVHISDIPCPAGSGPRHMEFAPDGRTLYCIAELSGEVLVYDVSDSDGSPAFTLKQQIQADEVNAGGSADIHIHPSGKWLYTSHRLDNDGIAVFKIEKDGLLEKTGYTRTARHPRNFMITDDGKQLIVACRDDKVLQVFDIGEDGMLTLTPSVLTFEDDRPSSVTAY